ncbi:MAG: Hsp20/alpha crystallin family protein [Myxococcales bacterium]|nr:Hsp20/alpha crystallin family protein [Myxococcales bacterium]
MRPDAADLALRNLERLISKDPILRDIVNPSLPSARRQARNVPAVDVVETASGWTILMEVPGVPKGGVKVRLDGTRLTISGSTPAHRDGQARVAERSTGDFSREFLLPFHVRAEAIRARLEDGLLRVELPRSGVDGTREVEVE